MTSMKNLIPAAALSLLFGIACSNSGSGGASAGSGGTGTNGAAGSTPGTGGALGSGGSASGTAGAVANGGASSVGGGANGNGGASGTLGSGGTPSTAGASGSAGSNAIGGGAGGASAGAAGAPVTCMPPIPVTAATAATVMVDAGATTLATVGSDLMGIHTSVYDGSMQSPTTPDLLKAIGVTSLRYPGGSYADSYHWELNTGTHTPAAGAGSNVIYIAAGTDFGNFIGLLKNTGANAMITVNYGMNSAGTGPGTPEAAAAWVAYANGMPANTTVIGVDSANKDWLTVGFWASLRAAAPLATDDGYNLLRISHPDPVGIKNWEVGNELYGNGYYYGGCGWEPDMHLAYPATGTTCTGRNGSVALSPATYGAGVKAFATKMKAVDPSVKVGAIVHWPYTEYADWNSNVLAPACASIDFVVNHWYAGGPTLASLLTVPHADIPKMYSDLRAQLTLPANACGAKGATMPIAVTEWGPNTNVAGELQTALSPTAPDLPTHTQLPGIFAAESYANFMEQGYYAVHWLELHSNTYLGSTDTPAWGYKGAQMAHYLAAVGDSLIPAAVSGAAAPAILAHASKHTDGSISVMLTNTSSSVAAAVTVNVTGGTTLTCVGWRYAYTPVMTDMDGPVTGAPIFAAADGGSVAVLVPAYSVVVVAFPKK
jgi:hypothetical protein